MTVAFWFGLYAYTPFVNPQLIVMGVSASFMGFVGGAYGLTQVILRVPAGVATDRWRKKYIICVGCLCVGLAPLIMFLFHNPVGFLLGRALGGAAAASWVTVTVLYTSYYPPDQATRSITVVNLATQIGRLVSFFLAGFLASRFGPQAAFLLSTAGGIVAFGISFFVRDEKAPSDKKPLTIRELVAVGSERNLLIVSTLALCLQTVGFATYFAFTANHAVAIGASSAQLGYLPVALLAPAIILGYLMNKFILQRVDGKYLVILGFFLISLYCFLVPLTSSVWQLFIVQTLGGAGNMLAFSLLMGMSVLRVATEKRGAAMGFYQSVYSIGMMIGPMIFGLLTDALNLRLSFFFMAGIGFISMLSAAVLLNKTMSLKK